jgi:hydroxymethylpyrimidine/phosphomethylpyrimidine kinase
MSVLTSVTAQNTQRVLLAHDLPLRVIRAQLDAIFSDFPVAAVKTGMLSSAEIVVSVTDFLAGLPRRPPRVVDPVMISKTGFALLQPDAVELVRSRLLPMATLVTPNRHEAELLAGLEIRDHASLLAAGERILLDGPHAVLLKGGHLDDAEAVDSLFQVDRDVVEFRSPRIDTRNTHGTGCTFSAAICAGLGRGLPLEEAIARAKRYVTEAIRHGLSLGQGHGPTHHFYFLDSAAETAPLAPDASSGGDAQDQR